MPIELFKNLIVHDYGCVIEVVAAGREVTPYALIQLLAGGRAEEAGSIAEGCSIVSTALFFNFMALGRAPHPLTFLVLNPTVCVRRNGDVNGRARLRIMMNLGSSKGCHQELVLTIVVYSVGSASTNC